MGALQDQPCPRSFQSGLDSELQAGPKPSCHRLAKPGVSFEGWEGRRVPSDPGQRPPCQPITGGPAPAAGQLPNLAPIPGSSTPDLGELPNLGSSLP